MAISQHIDTLKIQSVLDSKIDNRLVFGIQLTVKKGNEQWTGSAGNLTNSKSVFIASTTKLFVTAIILKLANENKLSLDDKITEYIPADVVNNLNVYNGKNFSNEITVKNLLAHTSGIPDYFEDKYNGESFLDNILKGNDKKWSFNQIITVSKKIKPKFKPGKKKAHYSDTNFQLLQKIIENITGKSLKLVLDEHIFKPLQLRQTYMYEKPSDTLPAKMYYKNHILDIPKAMASFQGDGGIVSASDELMIFITSFFNGKIFPKSYLSGLFIWNKYRFPLKLGVGIMRFKFPFYPEFIGHSGLSGAFAFYVPKKDIYLTGTVNQVDKPETSYKLMLEILNHLK